MTAGKSSPRDAWGNLMRAALEGDDAAYRQVLGELAEAFRKDVTARLARNGRGNSDGEDIVQEALLAVHLKRGTWDRGRPLAPWAYAVLAHKFVDRMRKGGRARFEPLDEIAELPAAPANDSAGMDADRMMQVLAPPQRRLVAAISIEGRSAAEVAKDIGSTEGAVRVALHRALKRLATIYREVEE